MHTRMYTNTDIHAHTCTQTHLRTHKHTHKTWVASDHDEEVKTKEAMGCEGDSVVMVPCTERLTGVVSAGLPWLLVCACGGRAQGASEHGEAWIGGEVERLVIEVVELAVEKTMLVAPIDAMLPGVMLSGRVGGREAGEAR